jgi:hypothetical protein
LTPTFADWGSKALFVAAFCVILSMYGGGFATVPAYLADMFGPQFVGAIHGRLLTAWSAAGVVGPLLVSYIRDAQIAAGVPRAQVYDRTLYILSSFLVVGFICNALVRPVASKWFMSAEDMAQLQSQKLKAAAVKSGAFGIDRGRFDAQAALAWAAVAIPILWGVWVTVQNSAKIFQ